MPVWEVAVETILLRATQISTAVHEEVLRLLLAAGKNLPREVRRVRPAPEEPIRNRIDCSNADNVMGHSLSPCCA